MDVQVKDGTACVALGDTLVVLWQAPANQARWKWHVQALEALMAENPQGVLCMDIILPSSSPPGGALRTLMQADFRRFGSALRKLLVVPLGDGMWFSLVRTIVRGTLLISGQSRQQAVLASIEECIESVQQLASHNTPSPAALRAAVNALFEQLGATLPSAA